MAEYETILTETDDAVTIITLNRPKALNALSSVVLGELIDSIFAPLPEGEEWVPLNS